MMLATHDGANRSVVITLLTEKVYIAIMLQHCFKFFKRSYLGWGVPA